MVSNLSRQEKFNQVRRNFCFYLDIQEHGLARSISRRLQDMGFHQEEFLTSRVTHVVRSPRAPAPRWREPGRARADAMLERVRRTPSHHNYVLLTVEKAITLLDKLYDTFCTAPRKPNVRPFSKHFIKIEFLDKPNRPLFKELDEWPEISLEPNPPKREKKEPLNRGVTVNNNHLNAPQDHEMTRKNRPRIKEKEEAEPRGGYCEACGAEYADLAAHTRSPRHAAFARDASNYLALDSFISASGLLPPLNGERRSLRHLCNGDAPANGALDDEPRRHTRCRAAADADRPYYKVVGVSTKLRSSGGFVPKRKDSSPICNGAKPLVVKFRKVRRSELSVLSDEAEQFMFPKRASSSSSTSGSEDEAPRRKTPPQPAPALERRRHARPLALKEDSSEEDSWLDDKRRRRRKLAPVVRRTRRGHLPPPSPEPAPPPPEPPRPAAPAPAPAPAAPEPDVVSPLREAPAERCMKWVDGRLRYTPAVEQLEFAFESVPRSEPWYESFQRQDEDKLLVKNVPRYFALYSTSPKLPYEMGPLPPLKPNCCPLSALPRRSGRPGPAAAPPPGPGPAPATRGLRTRALTALRAAAPRPRQSPREHASTRAMLGLRRPDDAKSTASDTSGAATPQPRAAEPDAGARLRRFLREALEDAELDAPEPDAATAALPPAAAAPDVLRLVADCDACDLLRSHLRAAARQRPAPRRPRLKKKNRTGWPSKRKQKKPSDDRRTESSLDRSSASASASPDTDDLSDRADDEPAPGVKSEDESQDEAMDVDRPEPDKPDSDDKPLRLDVKVLLEDEKDKTKAEKVKGSSSVSESDEKEERVKKKKRALSNLGSWLQPVVRVARVDPAAARRLRSAAARPRHR